jgi:predicted TPR repeat methyltransferase
MVLLRSQAGNIHFFLMALRCANVNGTLPLRNFRQRIGREWGVSASNGMVIKAGNVNEVEVLAKATRRRFSAEYKLKMLCAADACIQRGNLGALFH